MTAVAAPVPRHPARTVGGRLVAVVAVAILLAAVHLPWRPRTLCLLRELTGVPCPFCGGTTAMVRLGDGDLRGAVSASPLALAMVAYWPFLGVVRPPGWLRARRTRWALIGVILVAAELFQLARFHLL